MAHLLMIESWMRSSGEALPGVIARLGHRYTFLTRDPALYPPGPDGAPHPALAGADEVVVADTNQLVALVHLAAALHERTPFDGVLTTCDYYLEAVALVAEELGLPGPAPAAVRVATRKHLVREALTRAGVPNPRFAVGHSWDEVGQAAGRVGYPLVAKPVDGNSSTAVRRVDDEAGLRAVFDAVHAIPTNTRDQPLARLVLVEEVLTGPEVSVEAVTVDGHTTVLGITDKSVVGHPAFVESGHQFPVDLPTDVAATVESLVRDALVAIGWSHGVSHTEVMITPAGPRVVEINPRQGGNHIFELVRRVTGTDVLEVLTTLALGQAELPAAGAQERPRSAAVHFVLSGRDGSLIDISGAELLADDPNVVDCNLPVVEGAPLAVFRPRDNEDYLGHVIVVSHNDLHARRRAEAAVRSLRLQFADGTEAAPLVAPEVG